MPQISPEVELNQVRRKLSGRHSEFNEYLLTSYHDTRTIFGFITNQRWSKASRDVFQLARRAGLLPIIEEDYQMMLRDNTRRSKVHWIPLHLTSLWPSKFNTVLFIDKHPLIIAYMRKMGYTIMTNISCNIEADIVFNNIRFFPMTTSNPQVSGSRLTITKAQLIANLDDVTRGAGHMIRDAIMCWCARRHYTYVGLGDEIESIIHSLHVTKVNRERKKDILFSRHIVDQTTFNKLKSDLSFKFKIVHVTEEGLIDEGLEAPVRMIVLRDLNKISDAVMLSRRYSVPIVNTEHYDYLMSFVHQGSSGWYQDVQIIKMDALEYKPMKSDMLVGIYSLSNIYNPSPLKVVSKLLSTKSHFITNFPLAEAIQDTNVVKVILNGSAIEEKVANRTYRDWLVNNETFLSVDVNTLTGLDLCAVLTHNIDGNYHPPSSWSTACRNNYPLKRWQFVTSRGLFDDQNQTWKNSQTQWARFVSVGLRVKFFLLEETIYRMRFYAARMIDPTVRRASDPGKRITGVCSKGFFAVSGHMINLLLFSHIGTLDIKRYLRTIEMNVRLYSNIALTEKQQMYVKRDIYAEDNSDKTLRSLWHSWYEYRACVACYIFMCHMLGWEVKKQTVAYVLKRLDNIKRKYPKFTNDSMEVVAYRGSLGRG